MSHYHNAHYIKGTSLQTKRPLTVIYIILDFDEVNLMVSGQLALPKRIAYRALSSIAYAFNTSHQQSFCINVIRHKSFFCICGEEHLEGHLLRAFTLVHAKIYIYFSIRTYVRTQFVTIPNWSQVRTLKAQTMKFVERGCSRTRLTFSK